MTDFKTHLTQQSKKLRCFSLPPAMPGVSRVDNEKAMLDAWTRDVCKNAKLHIKCDLTMKQSVELFCPSPYAENRLFLNEDLAFANIGQFAERLNYIIYKNAYRRYGKKLNMIAAVEGGKYQLRETPIKGHRDKRFHAHLLIQYPDLTYFRFDGKNTTFTKPLFMSLIEQTWKDTMFGYEEHYIGEIRNKWDAVQYCGKDGQSGIVYQEYHKD